MLQISLYRSFEFYVLANFQTTTAVGKKTRLGMKQHQAVSEEIKPVALCIVDG